ncbi:monovalent cation:proton antiporter-2 (CPA2) family protein [Acidihalobacter ferrooxydans]|uniref:Potassium transporter KefB n=1 Tax=Acidihalobacter ferrooxydans TaxID=1765967 RepID=A0A1P8UK61_9GAMM|nr:monovalent cation:proton antiporter-2 (CPA2) family protein [Acidihalobacter ferrooxydans]APZ44223.1 potassium transporter KefB [Acidihalobacter ferrooxydans]
MSGQIIQSVLILLACSVLAVGVVRRLQLSSIIGYLLVGAVIGPHAFGLIDDSELIHLLAEIGVVFLLFTIGLEFSINQFWSMRRVVVGLGGAQVVLSSLIGALAAWLSGVGWAGAVVAGGALALSSTAIVVKQLDEQLELHSRHGRLALGVLLFQDLAVVPFLVAIPILASGKLDGMGWQFAIALGKGIVALGIMLAAGRWVLRPLFHSVAAARSTELFTLSVLLVTLAAASVTYWLGLSLALGAFLAGMMLSETEYRHQIETEIRAFRDVLMGVFFVSIGLQLDMRALLDVWPWVLLMLTGLVLGKGLLIMALTRWAGYEPGVALRTGMVLAQGGEFGFALLALALNRGLLSAADSQAILATVILSMALAPLLLRYNGRVAKALFAKSYVKRRITQTRQLGWAAREVSDHVILCGFGRIGQNLARFLRAEGLEYVALDLDPYIIRDAWEAGEHVFYGDSTHGEILRAAGLTRARVLVITFNDAHTAERIILEARKRRADLPILVRTLEESDLERLEQAGATAVIPEILESSLLIARALLERLDIAAEEIDALIERERADRYRSLRGRFRGETEQLTEALHSVTIHTGSAAIGKPLRDFDIAGHGAHIEALRRAGIRGEEPDPDLRLEEGDVLVLRGAADVLTRIEAELTRVEATE